MASIDNGAQAPGFYRFQLGNLRALTVNDGFFRKSGSPAELVRNADEDAVHAALREAFLPVEHLDLLFTVPFVETPQGLAAFDIGTGGNFGPNSGKLTANLRAAGYGPEDVAHIVFTHLHVDHCSGLTDGGGQALYPRAQLHVPKPEWDYWLSEDEAARAPADARGGFDNVRQRFAPYEGRVTLFTPGEDVLPGVRSVPTHGHTPGHTSFLVEDGGETLLVLGDVTNRPELFLVHPDWQLVFDSDGDGAVATRHRVLDQAVADKLLVAAFHWPFPSLGHVAKTAGGYRMVPVVWSAEAK